MKTHNKQLSAAAKDTGVQSQFDYATFQNSGYKGTYLQLLKLKKN